MNINVSFNSHYILYKTALREEVRVSGCHSKNLNKVLLSHSDLLMRSKIRKKKLQLNRD